MILGEIDCLPIKEFSLTFNEWKGFKNWAEPVIGKIDDYEDEISMKNLPPGRTSFLKSCERWASEDYKVPKQEY